MHLRDPKDCRFDCCSLGEIMLRFDPGEGRIRNARQFRVWEGGGEYNVTRGLSKCFGLDTAVVTALADNDVGLLVADLIAQGGVDRRFIHWVDADPAGRRVRNGLNFTERGFGVRAAKGVSDRGHTAISQLRPGDIDWERIFGHYGVRWLHTGGIFAALSESTADVAEEAMQCARKHGTVISYDLNYRASLWRDIGGKAQAQTVNQRLAPLVDVMIGNEEDFTACLGFEVEGTDKHLTELPIDGFRRMIEQVRTRYPNFQVIATTLRAVHSASRNDWSAICYHDGTFHQSQSFSELEILDRVGGGDSFASGLIYGLLSGHDAEWALNCGTCHGALAMTTPGDTSTVDADEVFALMRGGSARVAR